MGEYLLHRVVIGEVDLEIGLEPDVLLKVLELRVGELLVEGCFFVFLADGLLVLADDN
jgi:hypothetical protein